MLDMTSSQPAPRLSDNLTSLGNHGLASGWKACAADAR